MAAIPDFTEIERKLVAQTLLERYGRDIAIESGDAEIELVAESGQLDTCPVLYWEERGAHFVIFKLAESRYRAQFYYSDTLQFGTGKEAFENLGDCVITVLQVQSDHESQMKGIRSGMTAQNFDDYDGPLVI
jgi:hypothetical protein